MANQPNNQFDNNRAVISALGCLQIAFLGAIFVSTCARLTAADSSVDSHQKTASAARTAAESRVPTISEITRAMAAWQRQLQRFAVVYAYREEFLRRGYSDDNLSLRRNLIRDFRYDLGRLHSFGATVSVGTAPTDRRPPITFLDESRYVKWWPRSRLAREVDVAAVLARGGDFIRDCEWLESLGFFPDKAHRPKHDGFFLPEAFQRAEYFVRPEWEEVDGARCRVVELRGIDRVWLDPDIGFMPRRREWRPPSGGSTIYRAHNFECSDFRRFGENLWLPWLTRREMLMHVDTERSVLAPVLIAHTIVGMLSESADVRPPTYLPGTVVTEDRDGTVLIARILPGGEDTLDEVIARIGIVDHASALFRSGCGRRLVDLGGAILAGCLIGASLRQRCDDETMRGPAKEVVP
ncbi:MAG TPA: hypothetical protein VF278_11885 [Pirellulales bacterium]